MTRDLSFNNNVRVGQRILHVQTSFASEARQISVDVFDKGQLLDRREFILSQDVSDKELEKEVKYFHRFIISDLELLYSITEKVRHSKHAFSIKKLGDLYQERGLFDEAIEQYNLAEKIDPNVEDCYYEHGKALFKRGNYQTALEKLLAAVDQTPRYPDLHLLVAKTHWQLKHYVLSIQSLHRAIELNDSYDVAFYTLGLYLLYTTQHDPKNPELPPVIERIKLARKYFQRSVSLSSAYDVNLIDSGFKKLDLKENIDAAMRDFENAYHEPGKIRKNIFADSDFYLKFMFAGLDKDERRLNNYLQSLERAVQYHPEYADLHKSLGSAYLIESWHFFTKAVEEYRQAVKINPSFDKAGKALKLLENDSRGFIILLRSLLK